MKGKDAALTPVLSAKAAGLRHVSDSKPGIKRTRAGRGMRYVDPNGRPIRNRQELRRFKSLAIPPAWTNVWICPSPDGHIQATGRDARGRKQYRYHPRWREVRDETKYDRIVAFARALPVIRRKVRRDLAVPDLPRQKILAAVVRLLETTLIRVGNEEYARHNASFGLTTMRDRHVEVSGATVKFRFRGKSGRQHDVALTDRRLAAIVKRSQDLPGYELFQYQDEAGEHRTIDAVDVNGYLRDICGQEFTAKDFRTWAGTVLAAQALRELAVKHPDKATKRNVVRAVETVARRLGNTTAICRKCYIHPAVIDAYLDGSLIKILDRRVRTELARRLPADEVAVLALLQARLARNGHKRNGNLSKQLKASLSLSRKAHLQPAG